MDEKIEDVVNNMLESQREMFEAVASRRGAAYEKIVHRAANSYSAVLWATEDVPLSVVRAFVHAAACVLVMGGLELQMLLGREPTREEADEFNDYVKVISEKQVKTVWKIVDDEK